MEDGVEVAADVCRRLRVEGQRDIQYPADRLLGEIVIGGAKATGEDQQVRPLLGDGYRFLQPLGVVAHHGVVQHIHAHGGQRLRQLLRIRVGDVAQQQLGTHGDDLCVIGHRITSFDDLPDGIFVSRFFFVPPAGHFLPTAGKVGRRGATSQNGQQKPPSLT